jgi:hypothetical protein
MVEQVKHKLPLWLKFFTVGQLLYPRPEFRDRDAYDVEFFPAFRRYGRWYPVLTLMQGKYCDNIDLPISADEKDIMDNDPFTLSLVIPRSSPCADDGGGIYALDSDEVAPMAATNTSLCQTLESGNVSSYRGSFYLTAAVCQLYPSLRSYNGFITNCQVLEGSAASPRPLIRAWDSKLKLSNFIFADPCIINYAVYSSSKYSDGPGLITLIGGPINNTVNYTGPSDCLYSLPLYWDEAIDDTLSGVLKSPEDGDCYVTGNYSDIVCIDKWWLATVYNGRNASVSRVSHFMQNIAGSLTRVQLRNWHRSRWETRIRMGSGNANGGMHAVRMDLAPLPSCSYSIYGRSPGRGDVLKGQRPAREYSMENMSIAVSGLSAGSGGV